MNRQSRSKRQKSLEGMFGKSENSQAILNIASTVITGGINFFTIPLFTSILGAADYGTVTLYVSWVQIMSLLVGFESNGTFAQANVAFSEGEQRSYQKSVFILSMLSFLAISMICLLLNNYITVFAGIDRALLLFVLLQSFGASCIKLLNFRFIFCKNAFNNFLLSVGLSLSTSIVSIVLIFTIFAAEPAYGRVVGLALPTLIIGLSVSGLVFCDSSTKFKLRYWRFCIPLCIPLMLHSFGQVVMNQTDKLMLQWMNCGASAVGVYGLAATITNLLLVIYGALNNAFVPFYIEDMKNHRIQSLTKRYRRYIPLFTLGLVLFVLISPDLVTVMAPPEFGGAKTIVLLLAIGAYCVFCYSFPVNYEFYKIRSKAVAIGTLSAAAINVGLNYVLVPDLGAVGAAISTTLAFFALFVFHSVVAIAIDRDNKVPYKLLSIGLLIVIGVATLTFICSDFILIRVPIAVLVAMLIILHLCKHKSFF